MRNTFDQEWKPLGVWPGISLADSLIWQGPEATKRVFEAFGVWKGCANVFTGHCQTQHLFAPVSLFDGIHASLQKQIKGRPHELLASLQRYYSNGHAFKNKVQAIASSWQSDKSADSTITSLSSVRRLQHEMAVYDQYGIFTESFFLKESNRILEARIADESERFHLFSELTAPWTLSTPQLERLAVLHLVDAIATRPTFAAESSGGPKAIRMLVTTSAPEELQALAQEFGWIPVFLRNPSWTEDHYIRETVDMILSYGDSLQDYVRKEIAEISALGKEHQTKAEATSTMLQLTEHESLVFELLRLVMDTRNESEYLIGLASRTINPMLSKALQILDIDEQTYHALYFDELVHLLRGKIRLSDIPIDKRFERAGYWIDQDCVLREMTFEDTEKLLKSEAAKKPSVSVQDRGKGTCASLGHAEGRACVVAGVSSFGTFKNDDILVAESTTADYLPLMRQAAGVITEHGGITCHAAIVARELGIPAIVGYPDATRRFSTGQRIRFEAIQGTVDLIEG